MGLFFLNIIPRNIKEKTINNNLEIYFFDVGQADSILIKNSDNTMLIDAGNNSDGLGLVKYINDEIKIKK